MYQYYKSKLCNRGEKIAKIYAIETSICVMKIERGGRAFGVMYLGEADQHEQGEDVGVLQLERQLLDAVICEGGNDVTPQRGTVQ